jgi:superfamily II DNA/RNA helicase
MSDRPSGQAPARLVAVLGPTNTGKTHLAVERMLGHASGIIGLPLRLLAREVYDRIVRLRGARSVALITGEEKIVPPRAVYFVCTVEAMPLGRQVEFLAIDEIQLCADPSRGHVFTQRLLHARGTCETMLLGSAAMGPLIRKLLPEVEIVSRERFSTLSYAGSKKLTRLPRRSAVVAFSAEQVYAVAELIRRQRGGAAVVMGSLSPRTRNAQVALFQSGEVDFLVATDAIGMGLNMDVDHVAFAGLRKFDGKRTRWLTPPEVAQIAGRAGRYRKDGTFGVTGDCEDMDEDLVRAVEEHQFQPIPAAEWRAANLDFTSLAQLIRALARPPPQSGLILAAPALDEIALKALATDPDIQRKTKNRHHLHRLWEVCQTPDFRKTTIEEHLRLLREVFDRLTQPDRNGSPRLSDEWAAGQYQALDQTGGEIDVLAQRLAGVRTLAYIANRPDWLAHPAEWQGRTRSLEDRLSDTLHEKLMQRFIDRRTSVLMRSLSFGADILAGVSGDGTVTVEGQYVGQLKGAVFAADAGASALESKALRRAADRALSPEIGRRLGRLAAEPDDARCGGGAAGGGDAIPPRGAAFGRARRRRGARSCAGAAGKLCSGGGGKGAGALEGSGTGDHGGPHQGAGAGAGVPAFRNRRYRRPTRCHRRTEVAQPGRAAGSEGAGGPVCRLHPLRAGIAVRRGAGACGAVRRAGRSALATAPRSPKPPAGPSSAAPRARRLWAASVRDFRRSGPGAGAAGWSSAPDPAASGGGGPDPRSPVSPRLGRGDSACDHASSRFHAYTQDRVGGGQLLAATARAVEPAAVVPADAASRRLPLRGPGRAEHQTATKPPAPTQAYRQARRPLKVHLRLSGVRGALS